MSEHFHAVIWIDHHEARIFHFNLDAVQRIVIHPNRPTRHIHHKANARGSGHSPEDQTFFREVVAAIAGVGAVLVTGPANAKHELVKHMKKHAPKLMERLAGVETLDHPSDGEIVAHARKYFRAADLMT